MPQCIRTLYLKIISMFQTGFSRGGGCRLNIAKREMPYEDIIFGLAIGIPSSEIAVGKWLGLGYDFGYGGVNVWRLGLLSSG